MTSYDFNKPVASDLYADDPNAVLQQLRNATDSLAKLLDGTSDSNVPDGAIRINSGQGYRLEKWDNANSTWNAITTGLGNLDGGLTDLTSGEVNQLKKIDNATISNAQWTRLGGLDQALSTSDSVTFNGMTLNDKLFVNPSSGSSEGGQINLGADPDNSFGDAVIDVRGSDVRIFEKGGTASTNLVFDYVDGDLTVPGPLFINRDNTRTLGSGLLSLVESSVSDWRHYQQGGHGRVAQTWNAYWDNGASTWKGIVGTEDHVFLGMADGSISSESPGVASALFAVAGSAGADTAITWETKLEVLKAGVKLGDPTGAEQGANTINTQGLYENGTLALLADGSRNVSGTLRSNAGFEVFEATGTWFDANVTDDSGSRIFRGIDSGGNQVGYIQAVSFDGTGGGYLSLEGNNWRHNGSIILDESRLAANNGSIAEIDRDNGWVSQSVGTITLGSESNAQGNSSESGNGFLTTPWLYAQAIEAANERGASSTGIAMGADGATNEGATNADQIVAFTDGLDRLVIDSNGVNGKNGLLNQGNAVLDTSNLAANSGSVPEVDRTNVFNADQRIGGLTGTIGSGIQYTIQTSASDFRHFQQGGHGRVAQVWNAYWDNVAVTWKGIVGSEPHVLAGWGNQNPVGGTDEFTVVTANAAGADTAISWTTNLRCAPNGNAVGSPTGNFQGAGTLNAAGLYDDGKQVARQVSTSTDITADVGTGQWSTPDANRSVRLEIECVVWTDGSTDGQMNIDVDESGGTTLDYRFRLKFESETTGSNAGTYIVRTITLPPGGSIKIDNTSDPTLNNNVEQIRKFTE